MKKDRNARKDLNDLYLYLDYKDGLDAPYLTENMRKRFIEIEDKYDSIYKDRICSTCEWIEYYGIFKLANGRIGVDPKRFNKKIGLPDEIIQIMNKRNTKYFHPKKKSYSDYYVNNFVDAIDNLKREFNNTYVPIIKNTLDNINRDRNRYTPGDIYGFNCGILDYEEACEQAAIATIKNNTAINVKMNETIITLLFNFFHSMASRIEAVSVQVYSKFNPKMTKWHRYELYDNFNNKNKSSRDLPSFIFHKKLYLIWNFIKHNNLDTYNKLKREFPEVLIDKKYISGEQAKYYVKISDNMILKLLDGVKQFFIEWCELNCDEDYKEARWNYDEYFSEAVDKEIWQVRELYYNY